MAVILDNQMSLEKQGLDSLLLNLVSLIEYLNTPSAETLSLSLFKPGDGGESSESASRLVVNTSDVWGVWAGFAEGVESGTDWR